MAQAVYRTLREEGGLVGRAPSADELRRLNRSLGTYQSPLVNQEHPAYGARRAPAPAAGRSVAGGASSRSDTQTRHSEAPPKAGFARPRSVRGFSRKDKR
jgi:hypothetical protein